MNKYVEQIYGGSHRTQCFLAVQIWDLFCIIIFCLGNVVFDLGNFGFRLVYGTGQCLPNLVQSCVRQVEAVDGIQQSVMGTIR